MTSSEPQADEPVRHRRSASQLETYLRCPEAYRLEKVEKAPAYPAAWLTQGIAFHDAIEKWEATGRAYGTETALGWYDDAWNTTLAEQREKEPNESVWLTGGRTRPHVDIENRYHRGRSQVADYIAWAIATQDEWRVWEPAPDQFACEVGFDMTIGETRVIGFIDQIIEWRSGAVTLRDLKTGTKLPAHPRQLGIYRLAADEVFGIDIQFGDFFMSKNIAPTPLYDLTRFTRERVGRWFGNLDSAVTQGMFTPNPGDHCRICPVSRFCDFNGFRADEYSPDRERESI